MGAPLKLVIVKSDGTAETVVHDLDEYNLASPLARASVMEDMRKAVEKIREEDES